MSHVKSLQDGISKVKSSSHFFTPSVLFDRLPCFQSNVTCPVGILVPENGDEITLIRYLLAFGRIDGMLEMVSAGLRFLIFVIRIFLSIFLKFWHFVDGQVLIAVELYLNKCVYTRV